MEERDYVREARRKAMIEKSYADKEKHTISLAGHEFIIHPNVFNPNVFKSTHLIINSWLNLIRTIKPNALLEIGAGAGYLSVLAALNGANMVTSTDITPEAIVNIQTNIEKYNLNDRIRTLQGSVFEPLEENERFDVIFWNVPFGYHIDKSSEELNPIERTVFDPGYQCITIYMKEAHKHLTTKGRLFVAFSKEVGNFKKLTEMANNNGWHLELIENSEYPQLQFSDIHDNFCVNIYELLKI
ncbi:hypothetical protein I4U23_028444 [Adineta vaga]|nr:hypothetical protein I4U23_028444 [Adineta vaga]